MSENAQGESDLSKLVRGYTGKLSVSDCEKMIVQNQVPRSKERLFCAKMQDLVTCGYDLDGVTPIVEYWQKCQKKNIPMTTLPLRLLANERKYPQCVGVVSEDGRSFCGGLPDLADGLQWHPLGCHRVSNIEQMQTTESLGLSFDSWTKESNGELWSRIFRFARDPGPVTAQLLAKLGSNTWPMSEKIGCMAMTLTDVSQALFNYLYMGGAYGGGKFCGDARLETWATIAELASLPRNSTILDISAAAQKASFARFHCRGLFYDVAWDIGLACFSPTSRQLRLLAVTDTD